jgi:hypothetical protein
LQFNVTVVEPVPAIKYIAEKWFGLEESDRHRVLVEDPAEFLHRRAAAVEKANNSRNISKYI